MQCLACILRHLIYSVWAIGEQTKKAAASTIDNLADIPAIQPSQTVQHSSIIASRCNENPLIARPGLGGGWLEGVEGAAAEQGGARRQAAGDRRRSRTDSWN